MSEKNSGEIKRHRSFKEIISHNAGLKILSVVFAVLLWCYVVSETNPVRGITYNDVSINVSGMAELASQRLIPLEALKLKLPSVKVTLNVPYSDLSTVSKTSVEVSIDLSGITSPGKYQIPLKVKPGSAEITVASFSPSTVEVEIEELATAVVPVSIRTIGTLPDNLYRGTSKIEPETLQISGPTSYISRITQAQIVVDLSAMTDSYIASMQYSYIDKSGNEVSGENISSDQDAILVDMGILSQKTVPVEYQSRLKNADKILEGYEISEMDIINHELTIVGKGQVLQSIDKLYIKDIDLTGVGPEITKLEAELIIPEGVTVLGTQQQEINVVISEKNISKVMEVGIDFINNAGKNVSSAVTTAKVTVSGGYFALTGIDESGITVTADTTSLGAGTHLVNLSVMLKEINPLVTIDVEPEQVRVIIS